MAKANLKLVARGAAKEVMTRLHHHPGFSDSLDDTPGLSGAEVGEIIENEIREVIESAIEECL